MFVLFNQTQLRIFEKLLCEFVLNFIFTTLDFFLIFIKIESPIFYLYTHYTLLCRFRNAYYILLLQIV